MADQVLQFIILLLTTSPHLAALPMSILIIASWRVARLRFRNNENNYEDRVTESVADTIKEQICYNHLEPLFEQNGILLPHGRHIGDIIQQMVPNNDLTLLCTIFSSLQELGVDSVFYGQAVQIVLGG